VTTRPAGRRLVFDVACGSSGASGEMGILVWVRLGGPPSVLIFTVGLSS
jgi:hypothetical protein